VPLAADHRAREAETSSMWHGEEISASRFGGRQQDAAVPLRVPGMVWQNGASQPQKNPRSAFVCEAGMTFGFGARACHALLARREESIRVAKASQW